MMNLVELSQLVEATLPPTAFEFSQPLTRVAALDDAGPGDVVFYEHPKYLQALRASRASVALVPLDFDEQVGPILLKVARPSAAFTKVIERLSPMAPRESMGGIHPSAVVASDAQIDSSATVQACAVIESGVRIGAWSVIGAQSYVGADSQIGEDCHVYPQVVLREGTILGARVIIHSGAVIGSDGFGFEFKEGTHRKVPQTGYVQIDDDVEIGACTAIDRARFGRTWIQRGTKIDNLVQIAHNVVIGPHCLIVAQTGISGSARLGRYVTLAGQVGVVGHVVVGDEVVVAAKSGVSKDVPAKQQLLGMFGIPIKEERELIAHYRRLPKTVARLKTLENEITELRRMLEADSSPTEAGTP